MCHEADGSIMVGGYRAMPEYGAGGGLWSTPSDLARVACSILRAWAGGDGEPITTASARSMLRERLGSFGLGVWLRGEAEELAFCHGGDNTGVHAFLIVVPKLGRGAAIMTNGHQGTLVISEILRAIADAYEWPDFRSIRGAVVDVGGARLDKLAAWYDIVGIGRVPLTVADGALHVPDLLGGGDPVRLHPVDSNTFVDPIRTLAFEFKEDAPDGILRAEVTFGPYLLPAVKVE